MNISTRTAAAHPTAAGLRPLPWVLRGSLQFALGRLAVYGVVGLASELFFYNLCRLARATPGLAWAFRFEWRVDPRLGLDGVWAAPAEALYGQASLWMFAVYGLASLWCVEPVYRRVARWPVALRGLAYALAILSFEWASGWALRALTGYDIWFYADAGALGRMTSWYLVPVWCVTGLIAEGIHRGILVLVAQMPRAAPLLVPLAPLDAGRTVAGRTAAA